MDKPNTNLPSRIKTVAGDKSLKSARLKKIGLGHEAKIQIKKALSPHDDLGTKTTSATATVTLSTPQYIKRVHRLGKVGLEVAKTGALATVTVANTIVFKGAQRVVIGSNHLSPKFLKRAGRMKIIDAVPARETSAKIAQGYLSRLPTRNVLYSQAMRTRLHETRISQSVVRGVKKVRSAVFRIKTVAVSTGRIAKTATIRTYNVVRGLSQGTITPAVLAQSTVSATRNLASTAYYRGLPKVGETLEKATAKSIAWTVKRGIPSTTKITGNAAIAISGRVSGDDMALRGVNSSLKTGRYTIRASQKAVQTSQKIVRGTSTLIKTARVSTRRTSATGRASRPLWRRRIRRAGTRASVASSARWAARRTGGALTRAGFSITNLVLSVVTKMAAPLILVGILLVVLFQLINVPIQAIGAIFGRSSSVVDDYGNEVDEIDLLEFASDGEYGVPALRELWLGGMVWEINNALSSNDEVRLFTNFGDTSFNSAITVADLEDYFLSDEQWTYMVFPFFSTFMLTNHDLSGTIAQHQAVLTSIFAITMYVEIEDIREFCDQSFGWIGHDTGERYYSLPHFCGCEWTIYHPAYCEGHYFWNDEINDYDVEYCDYKYEGWEEEFECEGCSEECADNPYSQCTMRDIRNISAEFVGLYWMARLLILDPLEELRAIDISIFDGLNEEAREEMINAIEYAIMQYETALEIFIATLEILEEELEINLIPSELLHLAG